MRMITKSVMIRFGAILLAGAPLFAGGAFPSRGIFHHPPPPFGLLIRAKIRSTVWKSAVGGMTVMLGRTAGIARELTQVALTLFRKFRRRLDCSRGPGARRMAISECAGREAAPPPQLMFGFLVATMFCHVTGRCILPEIHIRTQTESGSFRLSIVIPTPWFL